MSLNRPASLSETKLRWGQLPRIGDTGGVFVGPVVIAGIIMSSVVLNGMSTSPNPDRKGLAMTRAVVEIMPP